MTENSGYCLKQKATKEMKDVEIKKTNNNRSYMSGICVECGCKMNKFIKKEPSKISDKLDELVKEDVIKKEDVKNDDVVVKKTRKVKTKLE